MAKDPFLSFEQDMAVARGAKPRVSKAQVRSALDVRRKAKRPVVNTGATAKSGYDPLSDRLLRAIGRSTGNSALERNLRAADENLIGLGAAENAAFNFGRGEGSGWDAADIALALPMASVVDKPLALAARGLGRVARPAAAAIGNTTTGRYLTEARPLLGAVGEAVNPATLNIGLEPSAAVGGPPISEQEALSAVRRRGRDPKNFRVVTSGSEPTLVVDIEPPLSAREVYGLSDQLRQDAIAQQLPAQGEEAGLLAGPRAQDWGGKFSPGYFYLQGGDTLGAGLMTDRFRAGAPLDDINALADKWGIELDPVNLAVHARLRDEALARGADMPEQIGQFTGRTSPRDPDTLQAYQEAQRRLRERAIAENYLQGRRTPSDIALFSSTLGELPAEDDLRRIVAQTEIPAIGTNPELQSVGARGVHIGRTGGLEMLDPSFYGQGHRGAEYAGTKRRGLPNRTYYYSGPEGAIVPEPEVLGMSRLGGAGMTSPRYAYEADLAKLYDIDQDPEQLVRTAQALNVPFYKPQLPDWAVENELMGSIGLEGGPAIPDMERWIKDRGYAGYLSDFGGNRAAALYEPWSVRALRNRPVEPGEKFAVGGRVCR